MTSKEALKNIKNLFIGSPINPTQQFEIIGKDLEVLEIIKKYLVRTFDYPEGRNCFCLELHKFIYEKEGMKFKEWLENE